MTIEEYNAASLTDRAIEDCAESMYEELGRAEEYAHDGEYLPEEFRAEVYRKIAERAIHFAEYLEKNPS
jgi:hypothetical protein